MHRPPSYTTGFDHRTRSSKSRVHRQPTPGRGNRHGRRKPVPSGRRARCHRRCHRRAQRTAGRPGHCCRQRWSDKLRLSPMTSSGCRDQRISPVQSTSSRFDHFRARCRCPTFRPEVAGNLPKLDGFERRRMAIWAVVRAMVLAATLRQFLLSVDAWHVLQRAAYAADQMQSQPWPLP